MRITYRQNNVKDYWNKRWQDIPADSPMQNLDAYPLKYAIKMITDKKGKILEAGCGVGRILRYYHGLGYNITGIDYIEVAINKLKQTDPTLTVAVGNITKLDFDNESFKYILAFGLYHNLEYGLDIAISETYRVLENGGAVCASFRADNIQTKLTDWLVERKEKSKSNITKSFHKMNLTKSEFKNLFKRAGFNIEYIAPVENMPILYKFAFFRSKTHKHFDENLAREEGYRLSLFGQVLQNILMYMFPNQFCNIYVLIARKP